MDGSVSAANSVCTRDPLTLVRFSDVKRVLNSGRTGMTLRFQCARARGDGHLHLCLELARSRPHVSENSASLFSGVGSSERVTTRLALPRCARRDVTPHEKHIAGETLGPETTPVFLDTTSLGHLRLDFGNHSALGGVLGNLRRQEA